MNKCCLDVEKERQANIDDKPSRLILKTIEWLRNSLKDEVNKHKETKRLLQEAMRVIEFYAEGISHYDSMSEWDLTNHCDSLGTATLPSGEMAREFLEKIA